jgi:hypothetical protein
MERRFWAMARAWTRRPRSQVAEPQNVLRCAPAAIAPVESVQPEHAVDGVQFGWLDEFRVRNGNCEQGCAYRKSNPDIFVMQSAEDRAAKNTPCPLYGAR